MIKVEVVRTDEGKDIMLDMADKQCRQSSPCDSPPGPGDWMIAMFGLAQEISLRTGHFSRSRLITLYLHLEDYALEMSYCAATGQKRVSSDRLESHPIKWKKKCSDIRRYSCDGLVSGNITVSQGQNLMPKRIHVPNYALVLTEREKELCVYDFPAKHVRMRSDISGANILEIAKL